MNNARFEKAPHALKVGDIVREKFNGRAYCRVTALLPFEGSGLVIEGGLVEVEDFAGRSRWELGWGALEAVAK